ncbi:hypothetical protein [Pseudomonas chlororaphis]|uniref:hypothetical protein n=1 Tax=Pseudomonas chlororaphis TaxID=587753 RepID=UPI000F5837EA|nr:hypothetical protein [Pseudomonas chlororaphis]
MNRPLAGVLATFGLVSSLASFSALSGITVLTPIIQAMNDPPSKIIPPALMHTLKLDCGIIVT